MRKHDTLPYEPGGADAEPVFKLELFVTGATPNSGRAINNLTSFCEEHFPKKYDLEIIDIYQQPSKVKGHNIIALPMLVKYSPPTIK